MIFAGTRRRPAPLLPLAGGRRLVASLAVASLCLVMALAAMAGLAAWRGIEGLRGALVGDVTVMVRGAGLESSDAAAARAAEILAGLKGVTGARILDPAAADGLIARLVPGSTGAEPPRLVSVTLDRRAPIATAPLGRVLRAQGLNLGVDEHARGAGPAMRAAFATLGGLGLVVLIALTAAGVVVAHPIRRRLAQGRETVDLLALGGADARFLAREARAGLTAPLVLAGAGGALAAAAVTRLPLFVGALGGWPVASGGNPWTLLAAAPWPLVIWAILAGVSALTARSAMRRAP